MLTKTSTNRSEVNHVHAAARFDGAPRAHKGEHSSRVSPGGRELATPKQPCASSLSRQSCCPVHDHVDRRRTGLKFQQKPLAVRRDVVGLAGDPTRSKSCCPKQDAAGQRTRRRLILDGNNDERRVLRQVEQFAAVAAPARRRCGVRDRSRVSRNGRRLKYTVWADTGGVRSGTA